MKFPKLIASSYRSSSSIDIILNASMTILKLYNYMASVTTAAGTKVHMYYYTCP